MFEDSSNLAIKLPSNDVFTDLVFEVGLDTAKTLVVATTSGLIGAIGAQGSDFAFDHRTSATNNNVHARQMLKEHSRILTELIRPWGQVPDNAGTAVHQWLADHAEPLHTRASRVHSLMSDGAALTASADDIRGSIVHMHVNRLLGVDRERESTVYALIARINRTLKGRPDA